MSPPPSALSPPLSAPPIPISINTSGEDGSAPSADQITPAEEEDDDVFEAEPTTPAEIETNASKRRSQSLSALHSKEPQSPLKVRCYILINQNLLSLHCLPFVQSKRCKKL